MKRLVLATIICFAVLLFTGCSQLPQSEIDAAKASLETAQQSGVDRYLADRYKEATAAFDEAMAEIKKQDAKVPVMRSYAKAKKLLVSVKTTCEEAKTAVVPVKEKIKAEVSPVVEKAKAEYAALQGMVGALAKNKKVAQALKDAEGEIKVIEATVNGAQASLNGEDYPAAKQSAETAIEKVAAVKANIEQAQSKKGKKK